MFFLGFSRDWGRLKRLRIKRLIVDWGFGRGLDWWLVKVDDPTGFIVVRFRFRRFGFRRLRVSVHRF